MNEYISREMVRWELGKEEALLLRIPRFNEPLVCGGRYTLGRADCAKAVWARIQKIPAADVAPVRHGYWIPQFYDNEHWWDYCSVCNKALGAPFHRSYCPNCGSKMDGEVPI